MERQLTLYNRVEELSRLTEFVEQLCDELSLDAVLSFNLNLVLEEAVTNVVNYAYPPGEEHTLTLKAQAEGDMLTFILRDQGKPFDPVAQAPDVDTTLSASERPIGGLGIYIIKQIMDEVSYQYLDGSNELTMKKKISQQQQTETTDTE
jgi:anti-sigma regulatory factor (Ser/Thr protein kinase)